MPQELLRHFKTVTTLLKQKTSFDTVKAKEANVLRAGHVRCSAGTIRITASLTPQNTVSFRAVCWQESGSECLLSECFQKSIGLPAIPEDDYTDAIRATEQFVVILTVLLVEGQHIAVEGDLL